MLSNISSRLLHSIRLINPSQRIVFRLLSTAEAVSRETGTVKRFNKEKGFGFITRNSDGSDCFVHFKSINGSGFKLLATGQEVDFTVVQGEKGVEARDVNILNEGKSNESEPGRGFNKFERSASPFDFGGKKWSNKDSWLDQEKSSSSDKRETGSVKRWTADRGFGFIRPTNGGQDIFCHARCLKDGLEKLEEGQIVQYRTQTTQKGIEACDVTLFKDGIPTPTPMERRKGTVKRWLDGKGFGFVQAENSDVDIFVHVRELKDGVQSLQEGQAIEFDIGQTEKGNVARNVSVSKEN